MSMARSISDLQRIEGRESSPEGLLLMMSRKSLLRSTCLSVCSGALEASAMALTGSNGKNLEEL